MHIHSTAVDRLQIQESFVPFRNSDLSLLDARISTVLRPSRVVTVLLGSDCGVMLLIVTVDVFPCDLMWLWWLVVFPCWYVVEWLRALLWPYGRVIMWYVPWLICGVLKVVMPMRWYCRVTFSEVLPGWWLVVREKKRIVLFLSCCWWWLIVLLLWENWNSICCREGCR